MLGMGLVVAIVAFLLVGTLKGLTSYQATMRSLDSKLLELQDAVELREKTADMARLPDSPQYTRKLAELMEPARRALEKYQARLLDTVQRQRDADPGLKETQLIQSLQKKLDDIDAKRKDLQNKVYAAGMREVYKPLHEAINSLVVCAGDLINVINDDMSQRIQASRDDYRGIVTILVGTSVLAVLLMAGLNRFLHAWVVAPIRDVEEGVQRVARGDFEHQIEVHSGDEMQELAEAFNGMTTRLREMYTSLAQQVNERSRQLVRSERLAGVGFLAAGVAHEINNPLASIAFCSEALESRLADLFQDSTDTQERETIARYLKMIQEEAFRCKEITQRLLAFSRGGERTRETTDLAGVIQGVLDVVQHLPNSKGKHLLFEPTGPVTAWVNSQEIKQVFLNLVVNALDSMDDGGTLTITHGSRDGMAELVFKDTGCGMTPDVLENIFEPFFTRSRTGKGTGLGLSISHRIITQHGGEIEAVSDGPGHGSTFRIRLPLEAPAGAPDGGREDVLDPEAEFLKLSSARQRQAA
jgi:signal transduction histidine kinase